MINRDLFRIDRSSYKGTNHFSLVLTAFYGKIMVTAAFVPNFGYGCQIMPTDVKKTRFTANVSK